MHFSRFIRKMWFNRSNWSEHLTLLSRWTRLNGTNILWMNRAQFTPLLSLSSNIIIRARLLLFDFLFCSLVLYFIQLNNNNREALLLKWRIMTAIWRLVHFRLKICLTKWIEFSIDNFSNKTIVSIIIFTRLFTLEMFNNWIDGKNREKKESNEHIHWNETNGIAMVRMSWNNFDEIYQTFKFDQIKKREYLCVLWTKSESEKMNLWILPSLTMLQLPPRHPAASVFPYTKFGWFLFVAFEWTVKKKWNEKKRKRKQINFILFYFGEIYRRWSSTTEMDPNNNNNKNKIIQIID